MRPGIFGGIASLYRVISALKVPGVGGGLPERQSLSDSASVESWKSKIEELVRELEKKGIYVPRMLADPLSELSRIESSDGRVRVTGISDSEKVEFLRRTHYFLSLILNNSVLGEAMSNISLAIRGKGKARLSYLRMIASEAYSAFAGYRAFRPAVRIAGSIFVERLLAEYSKAFETYKVPVPLETINRLSSMGLKPKYIVAGNTMLYYIIDNDRVIVYGEPLPRELGIGDGLLTGIPVEAVTSSGRSRTVTVKVTGNEFSVGRGKHIGSYLQSLRIYSLLSTGLSKDYTVQLNPRALEAILSALDEGDKVRIYSNGWMFIPPGDLLAPDTSIDGETLVVRANRNTGPVILAGELEITSTGMRLVKDMLAGSSFVSLVYNSLYKDDYVIHSVDHREDSKPGALILVSHPSKKLVALRSSVRLVDARSKKPVIDDPVAEYTLNPGLVFYYNPSVLLEPPSPGEKAVVRIDEGYATLLKRGLTAYEVKGLLLSQGKLIALRLEDLKDAFVIARTLLKSKSTGIKIVEIRGGQATKLQKKLPSLSVTALTPITELETSGEANIQRIISEATSNIKELLGLLGEFMQSTYVSYYSESGSIKVEGEELLSRGLVLGVETERDALRVVLYDATVDSENNLIIAGKGILLDSSAYEEDSRKMIEEVLRDRSRAVLPRDAIIPLVRVYPRGNTRLIDYSVDVGIYTWWKTGKPYITVYARIAESEILALF